MARGMMPYKDFLIRLEKYITEKNPKGEYLAMLRDAEDAIESGTDPYIVRELNYIRNLVEKLEAELYRINRAEVEHEMVFVKKGDKIFLNDFLTGRRREVEFLTEEEFHEYVNRRAGFKVY